MTARRAKASLSREALELIAQRFRALADPTRLALLLEQGLVGRRRDGLFTRYRIADPTLERLCRLVCGSLAERHESVRSHLAS